MRRYFILTTKKCRIYAAFGVSQTPKFCKEVERRIGTIIVVEDVEKLDSVIENYDDMKRKGDHTSNNEKFCKELGNIVNEMFKEKR